MAPPPEPPEPEVIPEPEPDPQPSPQPVEMPEGSAGFLEMAAKVTTEPNYQLGVATDVRWEKKPFPRVLGFHEDTSDLTDEQVLECIAFAGPPSWLKTNPGLMPSNEIVAAIGKSYVGKRHPTPIRRHHATWVAHDRDLEMRDFQRHLAGEYLLGAYLLDDDDLTGVAIADLDAEGEMKEKMLECDYFALMEMANYARIVGSAMSVTFGEGMHVTLTGGKGAHIIHVLPERSPAAITRRQMQWMCVRMGLKRSGLQWQRDDGLVFVECFPKQDEAGNGLGNLIRLPHGVDPGTLRPSSVIVDHGSQQVPHEPMPRMYAQRPRNDLERSRRDVQAALTANGVGEWVRAFLGLKYEHGLIERCSALLDLGPQMANAVGQVIHSTGWYDPMLAKGLLSDLEAVAETLRGQA